jgi:hypothetical protein
MRKQAGENKQAKQTRRNKQKQAKNNRRKPPVPCSPPAWLFLFRWCKAPRNELERLTKRFWFRSTGTYRIRSLCCISKAGTNRFLFQRAAFRNGGAGSLLASGLNWMQTQTTTKTQTYTKTQNPNSRQTTTITRTQTKTTKTKTHNEEHTQTNNTPAFRNGGARSLPAWSSSWMHCQDYQ